VPNNENEDIDPETAEENTETEEVVEEKEDFYGKQDEKKKKTFARLKMLTKVNKIVTTSKKALVSAVKIAKNPHPVIIANEVLTHANNYVNKQASSYVVGNKGWKYLLGLPDAFAQNMFKMLAEKGKVETMVTSGKVRVTVKLVTVYGVDFRYIHRDRELMYAVGPSVEEVMAVLGRVVVEKTGPRYTYTRQVVLTGRRGNGVHTILPLIPDEILPSIKGDELIARLKPFVQKEVNRSVFLVGKPGTGKTCMTEYIADKIGTTCLTFEAADLFKMNITQMKFILNMLKPDTLIVNDIDRSMGSTGAASLATLETISKLVTLTVVTANSSKLPAASLRPGRFDEVIHITGLGEDTVKAMLKDLPDGVYEQVKTWPAAFINELVERVDTLGPKAIQQELKDLKLRVEYNEAAGG
jgi:hypothetical protein